MGWPVSTASPRAFRNGTLQLDKSLARLMPRPARRLTPSSSTRRDSAHDATDMQQRDAARPYFDAARLRTPPTPHDDWHRAARRGATPHAPDSARRLAPSSSTRRDSARPPTPHGATGAEQLAPSAPPPSLPFKKKKRKRGSELSGFWVSSGHGAATRISCMPRMHAQVLRIPRPSRERSSPYAVSDCRAVEAADRVVTRVCSSECACKRDGASFQVLRMSRLYPGDVLSITASTFLLERSRPRLHKVRACTHKLHVQP